MAEVSDDVKMFENLLHAMGVEDFDALAPVALNDYDSLQSCCVTRKIILCIGKQRYEELFEFLGNDLHDQEIGLEDVQLAVKLGDVRVTGVDARDSIVMAVKNRINRKELFSPVDKDAVLIRYPQEMFNQRSHTFVPGYEAYAEPSTNGNGTNGADVTMEVVSAEESVEGSNKTHAAAPTTKTDMPPSILKFSASSSSSSASAPKKLATSKGFEGNESD